MPAPSPPWPFLKSSLCSSCLCGENSFFCTNVEQIPHKYLDANLEQAYNYLWVPRDPESGKKLSAKVVGSEQPDRSRRATMRKESRGTCRRSAHINECRQEPEGNTEMDRVSGTGSPQGWEGSGRTRKRSGRKWRSARWIDTSGEGPGKNRRLVRIRKDLDWNCGERSDTEPDAVRRRV